MTAFVSVFSPCETGLNLERGERKPSRWLAWTRAQEIIRDALVRGASVDPCDYAPQGGTAWRVTSEDGVQRIVAVYEEQARA